MPPATLSSFVEPEEAADAVASWRLYRVRDLREVEMLQRRSGAGLPARAAFQLPPGAAIQVTVPSGEER